MCNCGGGSKPPATWQVVNNSTGTVVQDNMTSVQARVYASRTPGTKAKPKAA